MRTQETIVPKGNHIKKLPNSRFVLFFFLTNVAMNNKLCASHSFITSPELSTI